MTATCADCERPCKDTHCWRCTCDRQHRCGPPTPVIAHVIERGPIRVHAFADFDGAALSWGTPEAALSAQIFDRGES